MPGDAWLKLQRAKFYADQHRRDLEFEVRDQVLLSTSHIRRSGAGRSLLPRFIGPHRVIKRIGTVAYELQLPASMKMHDVFHVPMLQPYASDGRHQPPPATLMFDGSVEFEVGQILQHRTKPAGKANGRRKASIKEYLVRWSGYGAEHDTREPESILRNAKVKLDECWAHFHASSI